MAIGRNIRFSEDGFQTLKNYCQMNGYKLGQFCETAALDKVKAQLSGLIEYSGKIVPPNSKVATKPKNNKADKAIISSNNYIEQRRQNKLK